MAFTVKNWIDSPSTSTPISAVALEDLETRLSAYTDTVASGGGPPTGTAGGDLSGTYPNPQIATGTIVNADVNSSAAIAYGKLALTTSIVNGDINASAAIAYSKLALTGTIVNADVSASAAIAYSKLNLGTSIVNADVNGSAAIAYSKLNLGTSIVNADVSASAAIAKTKLASLDVVNADVNSSAAIAYSKLNLGTSIVNADVNASAAIAKSKLAALSIVDADVNSAGIRRYDRDNAQSGMYAWDPHAITTTQLLAANTAYLTRFVPSRNMAIINIVLAVTSAATANDNVDVGIYDSTLATRLGSSGAVASKLNAAGSPSVALTGTVNLTAGTVYYAAVSCGAVGGTAATVGAVSMGNVRIANMPGATVPNVENTQKTSSHVLPTSISSPAGNGQAVALFVSEV